MDLGEETDDYEVVPVGPIRRLEKRIDNIESKAAGGGGADQEVIRDVIDIMKSNQKIVNDMTESTHELKNEVEDLTHKMDSVIDNMNEFMDLLKEASEMDMEGEMVQDMRSRIADAVGDRMEEVVGDMQQTNQQVVDSLEEINQSLQRSYAAQNKDQILDGSGNSGQSRSNRRGLTERSQENDQQGQGRGSRSRGNQRGNSQGGSGQGSERMRKLRNRFDKMDQESEEE